VYSLPDETLSAFCKWAGDEPDRYPDIAGDTVGSAPLDKDSLTTALRTRSR
jgi:hypothetical protein